MRWSQTPPCLGFPPAAAVETSAISPVSTRDMREGTGMPQTHLQTAMVAEVKLKRLGGQLVGCSAQVSKRMVPDQGAVPSLVMVQP